MSEDSPIYTAIAKLAKRPRKKPAPVSAATMREAMKALRGGIMKTEDFLRAFEAKR